MSYTKTGNPVELLHVVKNCITSLILQGKTNQPGTGDPSPTNIRPISGVGEYRSNGYYTDIVVTTNGVPKTYTIGPMSAPLFDGDKLTWSGGSTVEIVRKSGYIESYIQETLPGKWISDRDVYLPNKSPSLGAQVVYEL